MPIVTLATLKSYFTNGAVPNYDTYVDLIDSLSINPGSAISYYLSLMGLRGFWPMSSMNETPLIMDLSGQGRHLTKSGASAILAVSDTITKGISYALFSSGNYLYRADEAGLDITGTEASIHSSYRGLTMGAWIRITANPSNDVSVFGKYLTTGNQRSYMLYRSNSTGKLRIGVSGDGTAVVTAESSINYVLNGWNFIVGRFDPSTELALFHNGFWTKNVSGIPASIYNSTARFEISTFDNGSYGWSHNGALYFITASTILDSMIENLYALTKPLFIF